MSTLSYRSLPSNLSIVFFILLPTPLFFKTVIDIYWNSSNALFQLEEPLLVNYNMDRFSFSQMNLICDSSEPYSIYLVPREVYRQCHLADDGERNRMVADCSSPHTTTRPVTISFRTVSPTPHGLQFSPGTTYYFLSIRGPHTTSQHNLTGPHINTTSPFNVTGHNTTFRHNLNGPHTTSPQNLNGPHTTNLQYLTNCQKNLKLSVLVSNMDRVRVNKPRRRIQVKRGEGEQVNEVIRKEEQMGKRIVSNIGVEVEEIYVLKRTNNTEHLRCDILNKTNVQNYNASHDVLISRSHCLKCYVYCNFFCLLPILCYYLSY